MGTVTRPTILEEFNLSKKYLLSKVGSNGVNGHWGRRKKILIKIN